MKKSRFLWSAHRITERQKAGKARSIKGKQLKNSRSTASRLHVAHLSSQRDNSNEYHKRANFPENIEFSGISLVRVEFDRELQIWLLGKVQDFH